MASATQHNSAMMAVIDSGLGGFSVLRALLQRAPTLPVVYVADTAGFPYGKRTAGEITARAAGLVKTLQTRHSISHVVLACNTLSTLSLAALRKQFPAMQLIGTVPAIKVAAAQSQSKRFTLLATPNTAHSAYSRGLIAEFASNCMVDCYGAPNLARLCEASLLGDEVSDKAWRGEIAPCFFDDARGKTDSIILGCTHYPLVLEHLRAHAPWPVEWIDSSDAIARHALKDYSVTPGKSVAYVTDPNDVERYTPLFTAEGFAATATLNPAMLQ